MSLKNRYSKTTNTLDRIQKCLAQNGARKIMMEYETDRTVKEIMFMLPVNGQEIYFKLPARVDSVLRIISSEKRRGKVTTEDREQAYRTAWANIRDWLEAQMALIKTEQTQLTEIFLPYMVIQGSGLTLFEKYQNSMPLLSSGDNHA